MNCKGVTPGGLYNGSDRSRQPPRRNKTLETIYKNFISLDNLAKKVMEKYKDDPIIQDEVRGKIQMYRINFTISKEFNNQNLKRD